MTSSVTAPAITSVCVFCGSSQRVDQKYKDAAISLGTILGQKGMQVVYGGGHVGLMGLVADSALKAGSQVIGIIPEHISSREVQHLGLTELHIVDSMQTRKRMMGERSDAFIILPGGFGTLDEAFEILTDKQLGLHNKPIILFNQDGFWEPMIALIKHLISLHFALPENIDMFKVVDRVEDILPALQGPQHAPFTPEEKWK